MINVEERLKEAGVDYELFIDKHKLLHTIPFILNELCEAIQEDYAKAKLYKQKIKYTLNPVVQKAEQYDKFFWREICNKSELAATQYGELAENLYNKIINEREIFKSYITENGKDK